MINAGNCRKLPEAYTTNLHSYTLPNFCLFFSHLHAPSTQDHRTTYPGPDLKHRRVNAINPDPDFKSDIPPFTSGLWSGFESECGNWSCVNGA